MSPFNILVLYYVKLHEIQLKAKGQEETNRKYKTKSIMCGKYIIRWSIKMNLSIK
jgi:hypothetical protein